MKSLLFLIPSLATRGAERVLVNLVNGLDKNEYRITVQTLFDVGELRKDLSSKVEYRPGLPFLLRGYVQLMKLFSPQWLYRLIVNKKYDVAVAYLEGSTTRIISGCPYPDSKKVAWIHIDQPDMSSLSYCFRSEQETIRCYAKFDRVVAVSDTIRQHIEKLLDRKCDLLYNIIDSERVLRLSQSSMADLPFSTSCNVISVGCLAPVKGYDRLIHVHRQLLDSGILHHLYLIGTGPQESELKQLVRELQLQDTIHFLGFRSNPYPYMAQADLYVCSSHNEGLSTSVIESLLLDTPVVSTRCSGAEELLGKANEYGLVVDNSEQGLYDGLCQMLTTSGLIQHYAQRSQDSIRRFRKEHMLHCHDEFFQKLK